MEDKIAQAGHNAPPTEYDNHSKAINDLYGEAELWLDGDPITTEKMAEGIANLKNLIQAAGKAAELARVAEKKPFDDAGKEVQARYKPLSEKVTAALDVCKSALRPYLEEQERKANEKTEQLRKEAEETRKAAEEALKNAAPDNLQEKQDAFDLNKSSIDAEKKLKTFENKASNISSSSGRAVGFKTRKVVVINDLRAAVGYYWKTENGKESISEAVLKLAKLEGNPAAIPGIEIKIEKDVV